MRWSDERRPHGGARLTAPQVALIVLAGALISVSLVYGLPWLLQILIGEANG